MQAGWGGGGELRLNDPDLMHSVYSGFFFLFFSTKLATISVGQWLKRLMKTKLQANQWTADFILMVSKSCSHHYGDVCLFFRVTSLLLVVFFIGFFHKDKRFLVLERFFFFFIVRFCIHHLHLLCATLFFLFLQSDSAPD